MQTEFLVSTRRRASAVVNTETGRLVAHYCGRYARENAQAAKEILDWLRSN